MALKLGAGSGDSASQRVPETGVSVQSEQLRVIVPNARPWLDNGVHESTLITDVSIPVGTISTTARDMGGGEPVRQPQQPSPTPFTKNTSTSTASREVRPIKNSAMVILTTARSKTRPPCWPLFPAIAAMGEAAPPESGVRCRSNHPSDMVTRDRGLVVVVVVVAQRFVIDGPAVPNGCKCIAEPPLSFSMTPNPKAKTRPAALPLYTSVISRRRRRVDRIAAAAGVLHRVS